MLTDNNQIFRNCFVIIHHHLTKVSAQIIQCIIFERSELSIILSTLSAGEYILSQRQQRGRIVDWSHSCVTELPQYTSFSLILRGTTLISSSLLFHQLQCWTAGSWEGWWWRIPFTVTAALGLANLGVILPYLVGQLCWVDLFFAVYSYFLWIFWKLISSFIFPIGSVCCWLFVAISSQIQGADAQNYFRHLSEQLLP